MERRQKLIVSTTGRQMNLKLHTVHCVKHKISHQTAWWWNFLKQETARKSAETVCLLKISLSRKLVENLVFYAVVFQTKRLEYLPIDKDWTSFSPISCNIKRYKSFFIVLGLISSYTCNTSWGIKTNTTKRIIVLDNSDDRITGVINASFTTHNGQIYRKCFVTFWDIIVMNKESALSIGCVFTESYFIYRNSKIFTGILWQLVKKNSLSKGVFKTQLNI